MYIEGNFPVDNLIIAIRDAKRYDPKDPEQASIVAQALLKLVFCGDTMNLLVDFIGGEGVPRDHTIRRDGFFRAR